MRLYEYSVGVKGSKHLQLDKVHDCVALFSGPTQAVCHLFLFALGKSLGEATISYCLWCVVLEVLRPSGMFDILQAFPQSSQTLQQLDAVIQNHRSLPWMVVGGRRKEKSGVSADGHIITPSPPYTHTLTPPHTSHTHTHLLMSLLACCV